MAAVPADFKSAKNLSGYKYVVRAGNGAGWQASRNGGGRPDGWRGPLRSSPEAAILDYCAYVNGESIPSVPTLRGVGHRYSVDNPERDPEVEAALGVLRDAKAQREGKKGYVYLIVDGSGHGKIGYSVNPHKRVAELQTGNPRRLTLRGCIEGSLEDERILHAKYIEQNVLQEWFILSDQLVAEFDLEDVDD